MPVGRTSLNLCFSVQRRGGPCGGNHRVLLDASLFGDETGNHCLNVGFPLGGATMEKGSVFLCCLVSFARCSAEVPLTL